MPRFDEPDDVELPGSRDLLLPEEAPWQLPHPEPDVMPRVQIDPLTPNVARIYDVLLGGKDNYASDREAAAKVLEAIPDAGVAAKENRVFLRRAIHYLASECGIRQFIDIGSGLPTGGNVHEVAHEIWPDAKVAYVDNDPLVLVHARAILAGEASVIVVEGDMRQPYQLMADQTLRQHIDFEQPFALLLVAVLHFIPDDEHPGDIVDYFKDLLPSGSYLVISHGVTDDLKPEATEQVNAIYGNASAPAIARDSKDVAQFFDGLQLIDPGLVPVQAWRNLARNMWQANTDKPEKRKPTVAVGGVGRKL
jgi:trans-aconitate methyltransferase